LGLGACGAQSENTLPPAPPPLVSETGIRPHIIISDKVASEDQAALQQWIDEAAAIFQSPEFDANYARASVIYPDVYVSKTQDIISSEKLLNRLKTNDPRRPALWWPKTYVVLRGETAVRSKNRSGFGFKANRKAAAGPYPLGSSDTTTGQIELGRLHFARYTRGDTVEKSCAINTMVHEMSHTLSDQADKFWMHILDSQDKVTPPFGVHEAGYFIGTIAQCTYLQTKGRVTQSGFQSCLQTFSNPAIGSRFNGLACDDFPDGTPILPTSG